MTTISLPLVHKRISLGALILALLFVLGIASALFRWVDGFGRMSHLSDSRPWGIWISIDLLVGVAISAGAFLLAATVHIFHIEKYRPILQPALLTGFLGYILVVIALLVDIGQPQRIWHMLIYQNLHSPLFEVGMCVMTYTLVLFIEFSPAALEKWKWYGILKVMEKISIPAVILGITLSTMHQSSLGSLFLIVPYKMHALWYTPMLPLIFLVSAMAVGFAMLIFESTMSHWIFDEEPQPEIIRGLARGLLILLSILFAIKLLDLVLAHELGLIFEGSNQSNLFLVENIIGIFLPVGILLTRNHRQDLTWIFRASLCSILGLILHRLSIGLASMAGEPYFPHPLELAVTVGLFAGGILVFGLAKKHLPMDVAE